MVFTILYKDFFKKKINLMALAVDPLPPFLQFFFPALKGETVKEEPDLSSLYFLVPCLSQYLECLSCLCFQSSRFLEYIILLGYLQKPQTSHSLPFGWMCKSWLVQ